MQLSTDIQKLIKRFKLKKRVKQILAQPISALAKIVVIGDLIEEKKRCCRDYAKNNRVDYMRTYNETHKKRLAMQKKKRREFNKDIALGMLGGKCYLTGISAVDEHLEFAHVVAGTREKPVSDYLYSMNMTTSPQFFAEINRCVLMTHHAHIDYDFTWYKLHGYPQTEESFPYFVSSYKAFWASTYKSYNQYLIDYPQPYDAGGAVDSLLGGTC